MTLRSDWTRVSRSRPCPICERPDWCLLSTDGNAVICARIESPKRCGEAGWLHRLQKTPPAGRIARIRSIPLGPAPRDDLERLCARFQTTVNPTALEELSRSLGVQSESLDRLGIGWSAGHGAWSFPMTDGNGNVLGIRLRRPNGFKFAVTGGREGLFVPVGLENSAHGLLLVCEGPTDVAALLDMGFTAVVGRPNCAGGTRLLVELVMKRKRPDVVVVADADGPGQRGAANLASMLVAYAPTVRIIRPPKGIKDARVWLQAGGRHDDVLRTIEAAPARRLAICERRTR